jgi:NAD(P)-dependent dehydrogenase (short-subunit alcohol dehydrogenase family)
MEIKTSKTVSENSADRKAYIITGPTSGIGRLTALELAQHGTVVLVGRDRGKLDQVEKTIGQRGQHAVSVVCDLSDFASVRRAAAEIVALNLPIVGLLNNAGIFPMRATKNALGWDMAFATNHLGPFALTEAPLPHLPNGANVVFVCSGVEDPERKPAKVGGFRGGRYISAEASARGEWKPGGSAMPGADAYATSKQCNLATVMVFAHEIHGYASTHSNRVLLRILASGARPTSSCASWPITSFRCSLLTSSIGAPRRELRAWPPKS